MCRFPSIRFILVLGGLCLSILILLTVVADLSDSRVFAQPMTYTIRPTTEIDVVLIGNPVNARDTNLSSAAGGSWGRVCKNSCLTPEVATATWKRIPGGYRPTQLDIKWRASSTAGLYGNDAAKVTATIDVDFGSGWEFKEEYVWFGPSGGCPGSDPDDIRCPSHVTNIPLPSSQRTDQIKVRVTARVELTHCDNCILRVSNVTGTVSVYDIKVTSDLCYVPTGETTSSWGWDTLPGKETTHQFQGTLIPPQGVDNFDGRRVAEFDTGTGQPTDDTCHWPDSFYDPAISLSGGVWTVGGNTYGYDYIGWLPHHINYYRGADRAPCQTTIHQRMAIECGSNNWIGYVDQDLRMGFDEFVVWSERAGLQAQKVWP